MYHTVFDTADLWEEEKCGRTFYSVHLYARYAHLWHSELIWSLLPATGTFLITRCRGNALWARWAGLPVPYFLTVIRRSNINPSQQSKLGKGRWRLYRKQLPGMWLNLCSHLTRHCLPGLKLTACQSQSSTSPAPYGCSFIKYFGWFECRRSHF